MWWSPSTALALRTLPRLEAASASTVAASSSSFHRSEGTPDRRYEAWIGSLPPSPWQRVVQRSAERELSLRREGSPSADWERHPGAPVSCAGSTGEVPERTSGDGERAFESGASELVPGAAATAPRREVLNRPRLPDAENPFAESREAFREALVQEWWSEGAVAPPNQQRPRVDYPVTTPAPVQPVWLEDPAGVGPWRPGYHQRVARAEATREQRQ